MNKSIKEARNSSVAVFTVGLINHRAGLLQLHFIKLNPLLEGVGVPGDVHSVF